MRRLFSVSAVALGLLVPVLSCGPDRVVAPKPVRAPGGTPDLIGPAVVISQVYGGGGNSGATYKNDFIELLNRGSTPVDLTGWSVQYVSATGPGTGTNPWQVTALSGSIQPGAYYLVQEGAGTGGTTSLPTPNASGTSAMNAVSGKVLLLSSTSVATGTCPTANVIDHVSYGTGSTDCQAYGSTASLTNTTAAIRKDAGCSYTSSNFADFAIGSPTPRNNTSPTHPCDTQPPQAVDHVTVAPVPPATGTVIVGTPIQYAATAFDAANAPVTTTFTWSTSDVSKATVNANGLVTTLTTGDVLIKAKAPNLVEGSATLHIDPVPPPPPLPATRFSEIHYDNVGTDANERIEIEGPAGTDLTGWKIVLYSGNGGASYNETTLGVTIPASCDARGVLVIAYPTDGMQNGSPDGMALVTAGGQVVEFLSYEGVFTALDGPAAGMVSKDILVSENSSPVGQSLQRNASGAWEGPIAHSMGVCNGTGGTPPPSTNTISFSGRLPTDPPLPLGFEDQLFGTERDGATGAPITTTFTWTSETPALASIDAKGVMHALGVGTATFRATATDGTTATYSLPMADPQPSATAVWGGNTEFGEPAGTNDFVIRRNQFTASYSLSRNIPNWVSAKMEASHFGSGVDRCDCFTYDPLLPGSFPRYTTGDYTGAGTFAGYGIDRGHLLRSFDVTASDGDNKFSYLFSNIIPQAHDLNIGAWSGLEFELGNRARAGSDVFMIAGASGSKGSVKGEGIITIPAQVWKVAVIMPHGRGLADVHGIGDLEVIAVIMPNDPNPLAADWKAYQRTVDAVEALAGYDVLALLEDQIEIAVESNTKPPVAAVNGPFASLEGSSVTLSAAASTDPDGDALTFAWDFGDGQTGTGVSANHTYAQNGNYTVSLTATDIRGLYNVITTTANVANVQPSVSAIAGATIVTGGTYGSAGSFTDPGSDAWTATVNYGDGSGIGSLALSADKKFTLSHVYAAHGTFTVTVSVSDGEAASSSASIVTVLAPPVANAGGPYTSAEGSSVTLSAATSTDVDGKISTYAWNFGDSFTGSGASPSHTYTQNATYNVSVTVTDNDGLTSSTTTTITVSNVAPNVGTFAGAALLPGETYSAGGSFTDPGADLWSATVNYGDGSGSTVLPLSVKTFSLSHTYAAAGSFTVTVAVNDGDDTGWRTQTVTVLSYSEGVQQIIALVNQLVGGNTNSLIAKLNAAMKQIDNPNITPAINQLQAFENELDAMVRSRRMDPADAATLRAAAERVIRSITR